MVLHSRGCGRVARRRILLEGVPVERHAPGTPIFFYLSFKRKLKLRTLLYCSCTLYHRLCDGGLHIELSYALMTARILQGTGTGVALPLMFNIILE